MKKLIPILLALLVLAVPVFVFAGVAGAAGFKSGNNIVVTKGETVDHTLFAAGNNVQIDGTVKGDIFCAGRNITINATVEGDVICAGMNVDISGTVYGDVRAAGQVVTLSGAVNGNASLAGSMVKTTDTSTIGRDLQAAGSTVTLYGKNGRDADVAGSSITVDSQVGRDLQVASDDLSLSSGAKVAGNLTYYSHNQLSKANGADVKGTTTRKEPPARKNTVQRNYVGDFVYSLLALLVLAYALLALFPSKLKNLTDLALSRPGMTLLIGLAACIGAPSVIIISLLTIIGAPLALVILMAWIIVLIISGVLGSYYVGRLVLGRKPQHPFITMLVGVLIVSVLGAIPIVNVITMILIALFGSGMVVRELFNKSPKPRYEPVAMTTKHTTKKAA